MLLRRGRRAGKSSSDHRPVLLKSMTKSLLFLQDVISNLLFTGCDHRSVFFVRCDYEPAFSAGLIQE